MASGSRGRDQGSPGAGVVGDALDTLTNPDLARLPAAELVVRLHRDDRSGSDFADVALVLAARERRLAEAEDRVRAADVVAAGLRDTIRALGLRVANAEALALARRISFASDSNPGGIGQSQAGLEPQIGAAELTRDEILPARDLTASETQIAVPELPAGKIVVEDGEITPGCGVSFGAGGVKTTATEVGDDNMPRPSPLRTIGATRPVPVPAASSMPDEVAEERVVVDVSAGSSHEVVQAEVMDSSRDEVSVALDGKRKKEPAAASVSHEKEEEPLKKKPKPADIGALGVASEDSDTDTNSDSEAEETEEELCFTEAEGWKMLNTLKAQVAAWKTVYDSADAAQGTLQAAAAAPPPVEEVQNVIEPEPRESEATLARLQEEIRADTELEVWKQSVTEAQAQIHASEAEIEAWKQRASEAETRLQAQDKTIARLQDKLVEGECKLVKAECRIRVSDEMAATLQDKIKATEQDSAMEVEAQIRRATKIEEHLRARIHTLELKVASLEARGSGISRSDRTVATIDEHDRMAPEIEVHRMVPTAGATNNNKAQRQKGVSFYNEVFKAEMEKNRKLNAGNEEDEESLKKQAAAAASKELYLRCWSQAPYLPSHIGSQSAEEDSSGDEA